MPRNVDDWIKSYLTYTGNSEPPELYRLWTGVSTIAAVLQRKCFIQWGELTFFPNLYVILVGPSGRTRKGTAMNVGSKFLRELGIKTASEAITREALIRELAKSEELYTEPKTGKNFIHSSLTVFSQELTVFLGYNNIVLMSDLSDWYDCKDEWEYRTKNMGEDLIVGVWVNLIGATTPDLIRSALPKDAIGGGLTSRTIFVFEEKKGKVVAAPFLSKDDQELRISLLEDLEDIHMMSGEFTVTEGFIETWIPWYKSNETNPPFHGDERFDGYISRRQNHVMKLCMVLSAARRDDMVITKDIILDAVEILEKTEKKMHYTFTGYGLAENADLTSKIMGVIEHAGAEGIHKNDLMRIQYYNISSAQQLMDIIAKLSQMGFCKYDVTNGMVYKSEGWKQ